jgi:[NiFe] hydrogenase assembly HybE family chaperone
MEQRVAALVDFYRRVQTERMQGVPILNPALSVEAVGFRRAEVPDVATEQEHEAVAEGVLITPWFMSLVRLPLALQPHGNRVARKFVRDFGSEGFEFIGAHDDSVGYHETCALFSPMEGFATQAQAVETALASLALVRPEPAKVVAPEPVPARRAFFMVRRGEPGATP